MLLLRLVMSEVEWNVLERICGVARFGCKLGEEIAQVALVLCGRGVQLGGEFGGVSAGVVAHAEEFYQFVGLLRC